MDTHNLATVISPNILKDQDSKKLVSDESFLAIEAINSLIEYNDQMCEVSPHSVLSPSRRIPRESPQTNILFSPPHQVPEDLQSILNDSSLFNTSSDITTKEILKRYGDIGKRPMITSAAPADSPPRSSNSTATPRAAAPVITHVDADSGGRTRTWPKESSVRHVQAEGAHGERDRDRVTPTPHQQQAGWQGEWQKPDSPYAHQHQRHGSTDSQGSQGRSGGARFSAWGGKQGGQMGVMGTG